MTYREGPNSPAAWRAWQEGIDRADKAAAEAAKAQRARFAPKLAELRDAYMDSLVRVDKPAKPSIGDNVP
jgi:hypothetical protein